MNPDRKRRAEIGLRRLRWGVFAGIANIIALLILAGASFAWEAHFAHAAVRAAGEIVKITPEDQGDRVNYSFLDATGARHHGSEHASRGIYRLGDKPEVLYLPARPARNQIAGFWNQWLLTLFFGGCGVAMILPTLWLRSRWRTMRRRLDAADHDPPQH